VYRVRRSALGAIRAAARTPVVAIVVAAFGRNRRHLRPRLLGHVGDEPGERGRASFGPVDSDRFTGSRGLRGRLNAIGTDLVVGVAHLGRVRATGMDVHRVAPVDRRVVDPTGEVVLDRRPCHVDVAFGVRQLHLRRVLASDEWNLAVDAGSRKGLVRRDRQLLAVGRLPRAIDRQPVVALGDPVRDGDSAAERGDRFGIALDQDERLGDRVGRRQPLALGGIVAFDRPRDAGDDRVEFGRCAVAERLLGRDGVVPLGELSTVVPGGHVERGVLVPRLLPRDARGRDVAGDGILDNFRDRELVAELRAGERGDIL